MSLQNAKSRLLVLEQGYKQLEQDHSNLKGSYKQVEEDKVKLVGEFEQALVQVQDRAGQRNVQMQHKLDDLKSGLERKDTRLAAVLEAASLEPVALDVVTRKLEDMLETKNRAIKDLHFEFEKVKWQHRDVNRQYEKCCKKHGLPPLDVKQLGLVKCAILEDQA